MFSNFTFFSNNWHSHRVLVAHQKKKGEKDTQRLKRTTGADPRAATGSFGFCIDMKIFNTEGLCPSFPMISHRIPWFCIPSTKKPWKILRLQLFRFFFCEGVIMMIMIIFMIVMIIMMMIIMVVMMRTIV